jgi:putative intracellular protease/amidase
VPGWYPCSRSVPPEAGDVFDVVRVLVVLSRRSPTWDDLLKAGAHYADEAAVIDGNIVPAMAPTDLPALARAMLRLLGAG